MCTGMKANINNTEVPHLHPFEFRRMEGSSDIELRTNQQVRSHEAPLMFSCSSMRFIFTILSLLVFTFFGSSIELFFFLAHLLQLIFFAIFWSHKSSRGIKIQFR